MTRERAPGAPPQFDRLQLTGVRCFAGAEVPLGEAVTVILGENGSGKTTVAEAIASLAAGDGEGLAAFPLRHDAKAGHIALFEAGAAEPAASWSGPSGERRRLPAERLLFAYGRYRRVQFPEGRRLPFSPLSPGWTEEDMSAGLLKNLSTIVGGRRTTTLSEPDNHLLTNLGRYLAEIHGQTSDPRMALAWAILDEAVRKLGEGLEGLGVDTRAGRETVVVRKNGREVPLQELSDGYQAVLVILLDLVLRFVFLEPALGDPRMRAATVIVDEVDLHLHPQWQRKVVRQLTGLFPAVQWVLTTHSPAVVQGAIDDGHLVLRMREVDGATRVERLSEKERKRLRGAQLGSVVVDGILFGAPSRFSEKYARVERLARRLRQKLARGTATEEDRAKLAHSLDRLEMLVAREEKRWAGAAVFKEITKVQVASLRELARLSKEMRDGKTPPGWGG